MTDIYKALFAHLNDPEIESELLAKRLLSAEKQYNKQKQELARSSIGCSRQIIDSMCDADNEFAQCYDKLALMAIQRDASLCKYCYGFAKRSHCMFCGCELIGICQACINNKHLIVSDQCWRFCR